MSIANSIRAQIPPIHKEGYPFIGGFALISLVLFGSGQIFDRVEELATLGRPDGPWVVIDGYHAFMAIDRPFGDAAGTGAFYLGGGYKYAMAGEGCAFMHAPPVFARRPPITGWFAEFEGAGLDGLIAKALDLKYQPDKRVMSKIKHRRTADCVVAGYRLHKSGDDRIGSLLLGLFDEREVLVSVGVIGSFPMAVREELFVEMQHLVTTFEGHPWNWAAHQQGERTPRKNEVSRWNAGKDLSFIPLRPERVVEVRYDYMEGIRFRHTAQFERWRPDRDPHTCTYEQLERPVSFDLAEVLTSR